MVNDIEGRVRDYIIKNNMVREDDRVLVAVSGGADSMCLLFLLYDMKESLRISLSAVHVEHGIRGQDSLNDMEYVKEQCERLGIPFTAEHTDAPRVAASLGQTLEEAARNERYRIFESMEADRIALAHHMDDMAETVIFNLTRGSGIRGLQGIIPVRGRYIRPLLCLARKDTEEYCREKGINYRHDITNDDDGIIRNRIRHRVMPELEKINRKAAVHIMNTAEDVLLTEDFLKEKTDEACAICMKKTEAGRIELDLDEYEKLHEYLRSEVVSRALGEASGRMKDISRKHIRAVEQLTSSQSGRRISLIYGIRASKEFRKLVITSPGRYEPPEEYEKAPGLKITVHDRSEISFQDIRDSGCYKKFMDYATIKDVSFLSVRRRKSGDRISVKGGSKKLKDLLIEEKIPVEERDRMYFVASESEIVWIPDTGRIGERFKVTENTEKILEMEIEND